MPPIPTWPVTPETLPSATMGDGTATLTCGGPTFPTTGLDAPVDAEHASGPEFDALRASLAKFGDSFPGSTSWTWRLAGSDETGAIFLAKTDDLGPPGWVSIEVGWDGTSWTPLNMGQCDPHVVLSAEFGPASWALDPTASAPGPDSTVLHILVWEGTCSGGAPATGRISAPVVAYTVDTVTITLGVSALHVPPGTALGCPMPPGTPAVLTLSEPLGHRTLLDGGSSPPAPPSPANG